MNIKSLFCLLFLFIAFDTHAQQYVNVMDQLFTVHSAGNAFMNSNSNSRSFIQVDFPAKTTGYIYRISTSPKTVVNGQNAQLYELLKGVSPANIVMGASLAQFVINNSDGSAIDAYTFSNVYDVNNFIQKKEGNWTPCLQNAGVISACYASNKCLSPTMYFGFRNNNITTGLNIHLEIVALVDTASTAASYSYNYTIANGANQPLNYLISNDNIKWERFNVQQGYVSNIKRDQSVLHIRLVTSILNMVTYEIHPDDRYRIIWNGNRWDLTKY